MSILVHKAGSDNVLTLNKEPDLVPIKPELTPVNDNSAPHCSQEAKPETKKPEF
jgi:hypothetical protein